MDRALYDFGAVRATGRIDADGDLGFDVDPVLERATSIAAAARRQGPVPIGALRPGADIED